MAQLKIVYWRDIPGQVVFKQGRRNTRLRLSLRFMKAIERAAYRLKKQQKDALFEPWHDVAQIVDGDVREQARLLVKQLEDQYPDAVLEQLIRASGQAEPRTLDA
ncbi:MAG: virulence factor [Gammaproteobacteria bacterium]|nr:virulence factor [Gammaproteobacteria bacterium]